MVCTARQLEGQHRSHGTSHLRHYRSRLEHQCRPGIQDEVPGARPFLPKPIVSNVLASATAEILIILSSWSRQVIEHEKAAKARQQS